MRVLSGVAAGVAGVALGLPVGAVAQDQFLTHVTVGPGVIGTHTNVLLRFRQPMTTGDNGDERTVEALEFSGPSRPQCIGSGRIVLAAAQAGATIRHTLRPQWLGGRWCTGTYRGRVTYQVQPECTDPGPIKATAAVCPMFVMAPRTIATFRFRVTAR